jgi:phage-related protein
MPTLGPGVIELRIRDLSGAFRVMYVAKYPEAVYVLHAFKKKTRTTSRLDIELARARHAELVRSKE